MREWSVLLGILFVACQACLAQDDNHTVLVSYRQESVEEDLQRLRLMVKDLNREFEENVNISNCSGNVTLCVKSSKCMELGDNVTNANCSILVYKRTASNYHGRKKIEAISDGVQHDDNKTEGNGGAEKPTQAQVWGFGILSVGIISLSGLFGAVFWPLMKTDFYAQLMWVLIGLAVGSLTASSTFQLIPEGFKLKEHNPDYLNTALFMWSSFWVLYMFESLAKIFLQVQPASNDVADENVIPLKLRSSDEKSRQELEDSRVLSVNGELTNKNIPLYMSQTSLHSLSYQKASHLHSHAKPGTQQTATVAWMIIFGDGIHNFIDGMSIGAGFSNSLTVGTSISIAIACEEFPHELGDFAILINSGMSVKRALLYNFLSACTAFAGLVLGILLGEIDASVYIFAFAGGLFLYIALTDLMPELNAMLATGLKKSKKSALFVLLLQNVGIFLGVSILYMVTRLPININ